jgi:Fe-S cluster assembly iron-binding protein IscA
MNFTITTSAARKILGLMSEKGGNLALRIQIQPAGAGLHWDMTFDPVALATNFVNGVPIVVDAATVKYLDGTVIDWVNTPAGEGFGVYEQNQQDLAVRSS